MATSTYQMNGYVPWVLEQGRPTHAISLRGRAIGEDAQPPGMFFRTGIFEEVDNSTASSPSPPFLVVPVSFISRFLVFKEE